MKRIFGFFGCLILPAQSPGAWACCAVSRAVDKVVNADQTVIIIWDPATKRQHFIRRASFKSDTAGDIGFIVPSPSQPDLEEAGDSAFDELKFITAPVVRSPGSGMGCSKASVPEAMAGVEVLERKLVAGFDAAVLKAGSAQALVGWLAANGYAYSDAVEAWAEPYVKKGWPFTALKVASASADAKTDREAAALRISFQTDAPLFPYREPDTADVAKALGADERLLRIYFISDEAYEGHFDTGARWSGQKVWSGDITSFRAGLLDRLQLAAADSGPARWWLTEIEDHWPYAKAPGDVTFSPAKDQKRMERTAKYPPSDPLPLVALGCALGLTLRRRLIRQA